MKKIMINKTMFIKTTFKDSQKVKRVRMYQMQVISVFLDIAKFADFR